MSAATIEQEKTNGANQAGTEGAGQPLANGQQTALATAEPKVPIKIGERGAELRTIDEMWRFAQMIGQSGLAPKGFDTPAAVMVALQMGAELGLSPMASLQNIAVINGKPSVYGDCQLAVVRASGLFDEKAFSERIEGTGDAMKAICTVRRLPNGNPATNEFSIADARRAGLAEKAIWKQYPQRMLKFRARSWVLRDNFGDILLGFPCVEEMYGLDHVREVPRDAEVGPREPNDPPPSRSAALAQRFTGKGLAADAASVETIEAPSASAEPIPQDAEFSLNNERSSADAVVGTLTNEASPVQPNTYEQQRSKVVDLLAGFEELGLKGKALDFIELEAGTRALGKIEEAKLPNVIGRLEAEYKKAKGTKKR